MATRRRKVKSIKSCKHGKLKKSIKTKSGRKRKCKKKVSRKNKKSKKKSKKKSYKMHRSKQLKRLTSGSKRNDLSGSGKKSKLTAEALINKNKEIQKLKEKLSQLERDPRNTPQVSFSNVGKLITVPQYIRMRMMIVGQPNLIPNDSKIFSSIGRDVSKVYKIQYGRTNTNKIDDEGTMRNSKSKGLIQSRFKASAYVNPSQLWVIEDGFQMFLLKNKSLNVKELPRDVSKNIYKYKTKFLEKKADEDIEDELPLTSIMSKSAKKRYDDRLLDRELEMIENEMREKNEFDMNEFDKMLNEERVEDDSFDMNEFDKMLDEF